MNAMHSPRAARNPVRRSHPNHALFGLGLAPDPRVARRQLPDHVGCAIPRAFEVVADQDHFEVLDAVILHHPQRSRGELLREFPRAVAENHEGESRDEFVHLDMRDAVEETTALDGEEF